MTKEAYKIQGISFLPKRKVEKKFFELKEDEKKVEYEYVRFSLRDLK
jgi:hypothetical protein